MTYTVDTPRSWRRRFRWPRLPLGEGQAAWTTRALMLLAPLLSFTLVEYLNYNNPWTDFTSLQTALNLAWYYLGELFFYFVLRRRASAVKWAMGIAWGLGMANHYLISFRGRTLFPGDFLTLRTAANVAGNYDYRPDSMQWLTIGVFAAVLLALSFLPNEKKRPFPWRLFVPAAGEDGMIRPVNVIVIMNESLSDLSVLPGVESNTDAMPFLRSLTENTIKGYAYSSVFGGTTANSEYEFLTGNTTAFLPAGTVPYQMYVSDGDPTLVGQMAALGYRTVAAHPYRSSGWSRPSVYRDFGFDEVYFEGDFQDREYMRGDEKTGYVTDRCDYENLIRWYEEKEAGEPLFLFNVTMQNHSAYQMAWTNLPREVWLTGALEGRFNTVNQYLSLVYQSDQAFEYLLDYFSQVEEPTLILLFGDHQPQVATNFYTDVLGTAPDTALAQKKQMVPFVLWANYDIPEAQGVELSLNYLSALLMDTANLPMTGYQKYLARLWEAAPVINTVGIRDAGGNWYGENEALPEELEAAVEDYRVLLYNHVFDKKNRVEGFFTLTE